MVFPARTDMCKLENCSDAVTIEEREDEQDNDSKISDDSDEDEI